MGIKKFPSEGGVHVPPSTAPPTPREKCIFFALPSMNGPLPAELKFGENPANVIQLTLTLKMTTAQVFETSVTVNNSPIQDYVHPDNRTQPIYFHSIILGYKK